MLRRSSLLLLALMLLVSTEGCALLKGRKKPPRAHPPPAPRSAGTITLVNEHDGFVLIDSGSLPATSPGTKLRTIPADGTPARFTVSPARRRPFIIADIDSGAPSKGEQVFHDDERAAAIASAAPAAPPPDAPVMRAQRVERRERTTIDEFGLD